MAKQRDVVIQKSDADPEPDVVIAASIIRLADGVDQLLDGPLQRRAIIVLLKDLTGMSMENINHVLNAIPQLREFVKPVKKKTR
jgi:hypothetical protein